MKTLQAALNMSDVETLLEAVADWENLGNQDYFMMQQVKNMPIPSEEENEYLHKVLTSLKQHFADQEKSIKMARQIREEKSVFVRAKLLMIKQSVAANMLWSNPDDAGVGDTIPTQKKEVVVNTTSSIEDYKAKYDEAVRFITEVGILSHYEKFLKENEVVQ